MIQQQVSLDNETNETVKKMAKDLSLSLSSVLRMLIVERLKMYAPAGIAAKPTAGAANIPAKEVLA